MKNSINLKTPKLSTIIIFLFVVWLIIFNTFREKIDSIYQANRELPTTEEGYTAHEETNNEE